MTEDRGRKGRGYDALIRKQKTTRNCAWPLKRLKRGDENELERFLRLEKVVASKQLRLALETEEERRARLENDAATKRFRLAMEMTKKEKQDWRRW